MPVFRRLFDRLPVRISTSDLHHRILRKKLYHIRAYDFGVQFSFNKASICFFYLLKPSQQSQSAGVGSAGKKDKPVKNPADDVRAVDMLREAGKVSASLSLCLCSGASSKFVLRINPLSTKPSFQLWYPSGQRLKVISFS